MGNMIRGITTGMNARVFCVDGYDLVKEAQEIHKCSATAIATFGRMLVAGALMGAELKNDKGVITLNLATDGDAGGIIITANNRGDIKGYLANPLADRPLNDKGKLDVAGIVGRGTLRVIRDDGFGGPPYIGVSRIVSGEIGEDIAYYYHTSEQIPCVVGLGVFVNQDLTIKSAGGFMIQLLPDATEEFISKLEERVKIVTSVTELFEKYKNPEDVMNYIMEGVEKINYSESVSVGFRCDCNKDKFYKGLITLGEDEIDAIFKEQDEMEVECHFCCKKYKFTSDEF